MANNINTGKIDDDHAHKNRCDSNVIRRKMRWRTQSTLEKSVAIMYIKKLRQYRHRRENTMANKINTGKIGANHAYKNRCDGNVIRGKIRWRTKSTPGKSVAIMHIKTGATVTSSEGKYDGEPNQHG